MKEMICRTYCFEQGLAPPQEDFPRPVWTSMIVNGILMTNSVEAAGWNERPSRLGVCELCWDFWCATQNCVHICRLGAWLVCFPPELMDFDPYERGGLDESRFLQHVLFFRPALWESMRTECNCLPSMDSFPVITRSQLLRLWLREIPSEHQEISRRLHLEVMIDLLLASDPLPESEVKQRIESLLKWVDESPSAKVQGRVVELEKYARPLNTLHFDGKPSPEWTCMTVESSDGLVLDHSIVFDMDR